MKNTVTKKAVSGVLALIIACGAAMPAAEGLPRFISADNAITASAAQSTVVYDLNSTPTYKALTADKVKQLYNDAMYNNGSYVSSNDDTYYSSTPYLGNGYNEGAITSDTLKAFEKMLNLYRTLAGMNTVHVSTGRNYQIAALVRTMDENYYVNYYNSHYLSGKKKPADMSSAFWDIAVDMDQKHDCLSWGYSPSNTAKGWMDENNNKITTDCLDTGHRMALLDPYMSNAYFGYANGCGIFAKNSSSRNSIKEAVAAYPSPGYMPSDLADMSTEKHGRWCAIFDRDKINFDISKVKVTVSGGGKKYVLTSNKLRKNDRLYAVEFDRPEATGLYSGRYNVEISGLTDVKTCAPAVVKYYIDFVDMNTLSDTDNAADQTQTQTPAVQPKNIGECNCFAVQEEAYYADGTPKTIFITVSDGKGTTLEKDRDYTVTYKNNVNAGTATAIIKGIEPNYTGTTQFNFEIMQPTELKGRDLRINIDQTAYEYTGSEIRPQPNYFKLNGVKLIPGVDYDLSYENNVEPGKGYIVITGKGAYCGTARSAFTITNDLACALQKPDCVVTPEFKSCKYTGGRVRPNATVTFKGKQLTKGVDYKLSYVDNIEPGWAWIKITGIGKYSGVVWQSFKITN